ncbi:MAG: hypothetical protein EOP45_23780 [Sphingobacteriaceae bacterium]|nr:MAG: hypothetical protein EOP45_23780 [Sphingobacteriaceae bacterium]
MTIDYFMKYLWSKLGDVSQPQYCKIALARRAGAENTDLRFQLGSVQAAQELLQNNQRLLHVETETERQRRTSTLQDLENTAELFLVDNPAQQVRTCTDPNIIAAIVKQHRKPQKKRIKSLSQTMLCVLLV